MQYRAPKGVFDILPRAPSPDEKWIESHRWAHLESILRSVASDYGYKEIRTPLFESTELFARGVGETSDIVSKEMYTFLDRAERSMTLRPEGTAAVVRAFLEHHLHQQAPIHKLFYIGPMFRYERQQAGRYRQHHQFGAEAIGIGSPEQDVELIDMMGEIYRRLGLTNFNVQLNSVGDPESRIAYKNALEAYLSPHLTSLSPDSQARFSRNILRILDSKAPEDRKILENCPSILDHLSPSAKEHFEQVKHLLTHLNIPYMINSRLVRGLDYYQKTVFEITSNELGAHNSLGGGGRYDGLFKTMGGPDIPSAGFATGMERILQAMLKQDAHFPSPPHPTLFIIPMGKAATTAAFEIATRLRHAHIPTEIDLSGKKVQHGFQSATDQLATYALVLGDEELTTGTAKIKQLATREQTEVSLDGLATYFSSL